MAYTKTIWAAGDTVTSAKLNKIEDGLESLSDGGVLITTASYDSDIDTVCLDKTYSDIKTAVDNNGVVILKVASAMSTGFYYLVDCSSDITRSVTFLGYENDSIATHRFSASSDTSKLTIADLK